MSFLNKIKNNSLGIKTNPFTTERKAENTVTTPTPVNDPFISKASTGLGGTTTTPAKPSFLGGISKPGIPTGMPTSMQSGNKPGMMKPTGMPGLAPKPAAAPAPNPVIAKEEEKIEAKEVIASPQEMIKDMEQIEMKETPKTEEVKEVPKVEEVKETAKAEENVEVVAEEKKKTTKAKTTRKTTRAKATTKKTEVDEPVNEELTERIEAFFKMPRTTVKYADAVQNIKGNFVDENWEQFRNDIIAESDSILIEADMQEGAIKKTISKLSALREKIWVQFMGTKHLLESISNKDAEGLIERVKFVNLEGSNETARKKSGVLAVMNYKTDEGENINLYELYDETKDRFYFLKGVMDTVKYKTDVLITMSSALKLEKGHINNH